LVSGDNSSGWANPAPAGIIALGFAVMMFYALLTGKVPSESHMLAGLWLLGAFVIQTTVGLIELKMGNDVGGNIFLWFGPFFCLATGLVFIWEYFAHIYGWPVNLELQGYLWICIWIVMWTNWPIFLKQFPLSLIIVFSLMNICAPLMAFMNLGMIPTKVYAPIIGNCMGATAILALYSGAGMITNKYFGRPIIPLGSPIIK